MPTTRRLVLLLLGIVFSTASWSVPLLAQQVIATVSVGYLPDSIQLNPVTNQIYVVNDYPINTVTQIDGGTNTVVATIPVSSTADNAFTGSLAVNSLTNKGYVAGSFDNTVTVINFGNNNRTKVLNGGNVPYSVAANPVTNKIYVVNNGDNTVTVIDGSSDTITATIPVGHSPIAAAVNSATNKIYVANQNDGTVTVIDGASNTTTSVTVGNEPAALAVNPLTNQIYVGALPNVVVVIDGATNAITPVTVGFGPEAVAVNQVTNQIYVGNLTDNTVSVIAGATNTVTTTVTVAHGPNNVAVNSATNQIYVSDFFSSEVTVIDGSTNQVVTSLHVGNETGPIVVNSTTNRTYVSNFASNSVSVIGGASSSTPLQFVPVTPCRLLDTRTQNGGGGPIQGGTAQVFNLVQLAQAKGCADLSTANAFSLNVTLVPNNGRPVGYLTIWPTGEDQPVVSTMNSLDGRIKANAAIVPAGYQGNVGVYVSNTADVVLDIDGYFGPVGNSTLDFYPVTPCRVADTRKSNLPPGLGTPHLSAHVARDFPVLESSCIPQGVTPSAYSFNFTAVPYPSLGDALGYLEVWPTGQEPGHPVSTLNNLTGTYVANAAIVPAGTGGKITAFPSDATDLIIDMNGYFAPAGAGGLSLYAAAPCRVIDTRKIGGGQPFGGTLSPPVDVVDSICAPPSDAQAYVFNATVVPSGNLGYLTLWPHGQSQPVVSTLNAADGWVTSNMAIVPNEDGLINAFAGGVTQLILDISSYFAPVPVK